MTRKESVFTAVAGLVLGLLAAGPVLAQPSRTQSPLGLYIDIAYINLGTPPRWMALGPELEWRAGRLITFNPEVALWFPDTFRGAIQIVPGVTVNLRFNRIFFGGGVVGRVPAWSGETDSWIVPKFQMGLLMGPAKIALTLHVPGAGNDVAFGLTIGTRIGRPGGREPD
jgi:hypothetical protein